MKRYNFRINGNKYQAEIIETDDRSVTIEVNGTAYKVELEKEEGAPKPKSAPAAPRASSPARTPAAAPASVPSGPATSVKAPLPGVIIKVLVKQGDQVSPGQSLCTLETMKMENAIKAESGGVVTSVKVTPGQSVLQDEVLIEIG